MTEMAEALTPRTCSIARTLELVGERCALLARRQYQERPARFEYRLTEAGRDLFPVLLTLMDWGDKHLADGEPPFVYRHRCGADFKPVLVCEACGEPVRRRDLAVPS